MIREQVLQVHYIDWKGKNKQVKLKHRCLIYFTLMKHLDCTINESNKRL